MSQLATDPGGRVATRAAMTDDWSPVTGRHAFNEDAVLTPIFHALTRGGWRSRQHEAAPHACPHLTSRAPADPVDAFHRDPLTAPIPVQVLAPPPAPAPRRAPRARPDVPAKGRHHRNRELRPAPASRHRLVGESGRIGG